MNLLLRPVSVIETVPPDAKILVIGCRNEGDILLLMSLGFSASRIRGLDLISYSPLVDIGDMHSMPYSDGHFDVVVCGWTLSYSNSPSIAANEILRVTRHGGVVAVAVEYCTDTQGADELVGYSITEGRDRLLNSVQDLERLFEPEIENMYFRHCAPAKRSHSRAGLISNPSSVAIVFSRRGRIA